MRALLLSTAILCLPYPSFAGPQCVLPSAAVGPNEATPATAFRPPIALAAHLDQAPEPAAAPAPASMPDQASSIPAVAYVQSAGAQVQQIGDAHGFRTFVARNEGQFMRMYVTPDGSGFVKGLMAELSPEDLRLMAPAGITDLGESHGVRGLFARNGTQFQVFYVSPDGQRVIPGSLIDSQGRNVTREQVVSIPGTAPTVVIGGQAEPTTASSVAPASLLHAVQGTAFGVAGGKDAPRLWVFVDPLCSYSVQAIRRLQPYLASQRIQLAVVPVAVLDREDHGQSSVAAATMLSLPPEAMVEAWTSRRLNVAPSPDAAAKLAGNMAAAERIKLAGTPTFVWRKTDGGEGRADGLPDDVAALVASIGLSR